MTREGLILIRGVERQLEAEALSGAVRQQPQIKLSDAPPGFELEAVEEE